MATPSFVSVVIPTYQRCASVRRVLQALARQTLPPDEYEVIVSIDGSDDGTSDMAAQFAAPYRLDVSWQPHKGRAGACNAGIKLARGELVVLLDDDMEPVPGFLAAHRQAHPAGSHLGVLGAVPINLEPSSPPVVQYIGWKFNDHLENLAQPGYKFKLTHFYSGNFSIRRELLLRVDAFDESFEAYGNEDLELSVRLSEARVQFKYCPEALARQYYTKDFAALARDNIAKGHTAVLLARKHPQTFHDLKLSTYRQGSPLWRLLRAGLLGLGKLWTGAPGGMILFMTWLERRRPARLHLYYRLALDYFYWVGAKSAMRDDCRAGLRLTSLAKSAREAQP
jgi:cellulose synthase/poly-beta-1,6-N-acetylglucosamine synthase-like glycosyltransferase